MSNRSFIESFLRLGVVTAGVILPATAFGDAPKALYNKTILLSWSEYRVQVADAGDTKRNTTRSVLTAYISEQGRIFARLARNNSNRSNNTDKGPEGDHTRSGQGASDLAPTFEGQTFAVRNQMRSGARSIQATFNAGFTSCSLRVIFGKENGEDLYHRGMDGRMYRIKSTDVSSPSCSIRSGNSLAN